MTQEEKAKAYDEALKRAVEFHKDTDRHLKATIERIFPELKESEDERIRKGLIHHLKELREWKAGSMSPIKVKEHYDAWIAYLEKQKEQKPVPKFSVGDYVIDTNYKGEPLYQIMYIDKECYFCEYRGDKAMGDRAIMHFTFDNPYLRLVQKPSTPKFRVGDVMRTKQEASKGIAEGLPVIVSVDDLYYHCTNELISISNQEEYEFPPMNRRQEERVAGSSKTSAGWSEADEKSFDNALSGLKYAYEDLINHKSFDSAEDVKNAFDWLKAFPERFSLPPKQEWSEEDEKIVQFYEADCNNEIGNMPAKQVVEMRIKFKEWLTNRLKSLRPQSHWKPTKEQMDALVEYICLKNAFDWLKAFPERFSLPPKQVWSKEDENYYDTIVRKLQVLGDDSGLTTSQIDFLDKHRPQPHWKPTKEQMVKLHNIIEKARGGCCYNTVAFLESLYNNLEKLM